MYERTETISYTLNEKSLISLVTAYAKKLKPFTISLGNFTSEGQDGWVFIDISEPQPKLNQIHNELVGLLAPLRDNYIKPKYSEKWETFSDIEKERIKKTGIPYKYHSHITIAKILPEEQEKAIKLISDSSFYGSTFIANRIKIISFFNGINTIIHEADLEI